LNLETIRRLQIKAETQGLDQSAAQLKKLAAAHDEAAKAGKAHAEVSDKEVKQLLSAEASYKRLTYSVDESARSQRDIEKATKTLNSARAQGIITDTEYAKRLQQVNDKYAIAKQSTAGLAQSFGVMQERAAGMAGQLGTAGAAISALGPVGVAVAATV